LGIGAPVQRLVAELHVEIARRAKEVDARGAKRGRGVGLREINKPGRASEGSAMEMSNQPFAACTESEAIGEGAGAGTLGSTPARWLVAFTADTMRVSVSYKYGSRSFSGASWEIVSTKLSGAPGKWEPLQ